MSATREVSALTAAKRLPSIQPARELVPGNPGLTGRWHRHGVPSPYSRWNYHPEYEVHLIRAGTGRYVVGDHIDTFSAGQLVLVGSNLPHHWISDLEPGEVIEDRDVVFQFHPDWIKQCQAALPELSQVDALLKRSSRGIEFLGATARVGGIEIEAIGESAGPARLQHVFALLAILADAPRRDYRTLAHAWRPPADSEAGAELIDRAFSFILQHLHTKLTLSATAAAVGLSDSAFSRSFKQMSGQTFSDTVRKLRLAEACKLLRDTDRPIASICYRVGYTNLSNFNRQFRHQYGVTPSTFRGAADIS